MITFSFDAKIQPPTPPEGFTLDICTFQFGGKYTPQECEATAQDGLQAQIANRLACSGTLTWYADRKTLDEMGNQTFTETLRCEWKPFQSAWSDWLPC